MSAKYNLNEKAGADYFEFVLDDKTYQMSYPTSRDLLKIQEVSEENVNYKDEIGKLEEQISVEKNAEEKKKLEESLAQAREKLKVSQETFLDWCLSYVKNNEGLKENFMNRNSKFLLAFIDMVQTELGA